MNLKPYCSPTVTLPRRLEDIRLFSLTFFDFLSQSKVPGGVARFIAGLRYQTLRAQPRRALGFDGSGVEAVLGLGPLGAEGSAFRGLLWHKAFRVSALVLWGRFVESLGFMCYGSLVLQTLSPRVIGCVRYNKP